MRRLFSALLWSVSLAAQPPQPVFHSEANEILVDVVVRDKKGRTVHGLRAGEITVLEDGATQRVTSFREVRSAGPAPAQPGGVEAAPDAPPAGETVNTIRVDRQVRLVSIVFDRLGPDGRRLSRQAALDLVRRDLGANVYYGVFAIDRDFRVLQPYTNDQNRLRNAIERGTSGERSNFEADSIAEDRMLLSTQGASGAAATASAASQSGSGPVAIDGAAMSSEQAGRIAGEMAEFASMITRDELGRTSVFSLWAVIKELRRLPGRKSVLYFSEGLVLPNGAVQQFRSMISDANRSNVTVYAIDARGLRAGGDSGLNRSMLETAAQRSAWARNTQTEDAAGQRAESRTFDLAMDSIRANQQVALAELAESTGGSLMANTNDFRPFLNKLSEEFNTYYEITYRPPNSEYDGRFREIQVKVNRPGIYVQARNGYFALPPLDGQTVYPYEVPLLKALGRTPLPRDLDFRAGVLRFRQQNGVQQALLVFDLPLKNVAFVRDEAARKYRTHISTLTLIKDAQGRVMDKLSRDVPLNEPLDKLEGFQQGRLIVTRPARLRPGRYTVESVIADLEGQRVSARKTAVVILPAAPGPAISEMSLLRRMDKLPDVPDPFDPMILPSGRVVPTLSDTIPAGAGSLLSVFFVLYPTGTAAPQLILDLLQDGKLLARSRPELGAPDPHGAIPYVANTPVESLKPGQYEFRATLLEGGKGARRSLFVTIE
ncbi:MAG: VWA domain-containing protein [Bryobacterales bacterium]|nr:VWA domain-containing protein [Bryobacterales bacterium]